MPAVNRRRSSSASSGDAANANTDVYLTFLERPRVAVCTHCRHAVKPGSGIEDHFRKTHQLKGQWLRAVIDQAWAVALDGALEDPHTCELPPDGCTPLPELDVLRGYGCTQCPYRTSSRKLATLHAQKAIHGRGGPAVDSKGDAAEPGWRAVRMQSLSQARYARYWTVQTGGAEAPPDWQRSDDVFAERLTRRETLMAAEDEQWRRTVVASLDVNQQSAWVREMGWAAHLDGHDLVDLYDAGVAPLSEAARRAVWNEGHREKQRRLALLPEGFRRGMARWSLRLGNVPHETRRWLRSIDPAKPHGRPFAIEQEPETIRKYKRVWERYLCYCMRAYRLGRTEAQRRYGIRFTDEQWTALDAMAEALLAVGDATAEEEGRRPGRGGRPGQHQGGRAAPRINSDDDSDYDATDDSSDTDTGGRAPSHRPDGEAGGGVRWDETTGPGQAAEDQPEHSRELDRRVYDFCVLSLKQKVAVDIFANPLIHFTAVLGILDPRRRGGAGQDGTLRLGWTTPSNFTQQLAGLIWCGRILMLEHFFEGEPIDGDPNDLSTEAVCGFIEQYRCWLADGSHSPFSAMIRMMAYGKGHRNREGGTPRVTWDASGTALRYLGQRVSVDDFRRAAQQPRAAAEAALEELMRGGWAEARALLRLNRVVDSLLFEGAGRSFATHPENGWLRPGPQKLAGLCRGGMWDARSEHWRQDAALEWLARAQPFKRALLTAVHVWGGQPGRGPEMTTARHCDTQDTPRNVFVFDGQVMLVTDRDKNRTIRGISRKVARFLPAAVGKMMVAYIAWVLPFERFLQAEAGIQGPPQPLHPWLWKDARRGLWDTTELSKELGSATAATTGVKLTVSNYRHVAIELGRKIRGIIVRQAEVEMAEEDDGAGPAGARRGTLATDPLTGEARRKPRLEFIWDLQATHAGVTARRHYAMDVQFPNQLQPEMMANFREISRLWHGFLEAEATPAQDEAGTASAAEASATRTEQANPLRQRRQQQEEAPTAAPTRTPSTPAPRKRKAAEPAPETPSSATASRAAYAAMRQQEAVWSGRRKRAAHEAMLTRQEAPDEAETDRRLAAGLRALFGEDAAWRSAEQQEGARQVLSLRGGKALIVVLPTGAGKSALFLLPAVPAVRGGVSIVVVPFTALLGDLAESARQAGLDSLVWQPAAATGRTERERVAALVFVSADQVNSIGFASYADSLRARGLLKRIFVDECHTVLTDGGYRRKLPELKELYRYDRPVILLTATLPVRMEGWFRRMMLAEDANIVRVGTARHNIRYRVTAVVPGGFAAIETAVLAEVAYPEEHDKL